MGKSVYLVTMYRFGDRERHSYTIGIFTTKSKAQRAAEIEESYRGGKYTAEILRIFLNSYYDQEGATTNCFTIIKGLTT